MCKIERGDADVLMNSVTSVQILALIVHGEVRSDAAIQSILDPNIVLKNCTFGDVCVDEIDASTVHYYSVEYSFDPTMVRKASSDNRVSRPSTLQTDVCKTSRSVPVT